MYIEVREIEDDDIWNVLSEWEKDVEGVRLGELSLSIGWKSKAAYRLRAWRADAELGDRFQRIYHAVDGKLMRTTWTA